MIKFDWPSTSISKIWQRDLLTANCDLVFYDELIWIAGVRELAELVQDELLVLGIFVCLANLLGLVDLLLELLLHLAIFLLSFRQALGPVRFLRNSVDCPQEPKI